MHDLEAAGGAGDKDAGFQTARENLMKVFPGDQAQALLGTADDPDALRAVATSLMQHQWDLDKAAADQAEEQDLLDRIQAQQGIGRTQQPISRPLPPAPARTQPAVTPQLAPGAPSAPAVRAPEPAAQAPVPVDVFGGRQFGPQTDVSDIELEWASERLSKFAGTPALAADKRNLAPTLDMLLVHEDRAKAAMDRDPNLRANVQNQLSRMVAGEPIETGPMTKHTKLVYKDLAARMLNGYFAEHTEANRKEALEEAGGFTDRKQVTERWWTRAVGDVGLSSRPAVRALYQGLIQGQKSLSDPDMAVQFKSLSKLEKVAVSDTLRALGYFNQAQ